ncbi:MAG: metal ABC transporter permease [Deltaproteobacteria bacterium]|jgi:manganese/zinc/iron transport system permease protein|nr:metal ABC transporter permease [Deltaproteobacteria bacterium]MCK5709197.1 metal ABC transporter permease [Deltaproteobacteria bacterium]
MSVEQFEIQLIASVVAAACAIPGVFLVLRRMAMMSDAISHAILLGIVLAFFVIPDISSPILIIGAALSGVLTVSLVELLNRTGLVKEDAAIGLVFPVLFSIGVILIARYAWNVHLDVHAVLLGELAFAPFDRLLLFGHDIGPKSLYVMGTILLLNLILITLFYKELKIATFDAGLAAALGFSPGLIHYGLMSLVSVTAVGAFDAVGSILVVALMIAPPAAAYLLTDNLSKMILISVLLGVISSISGFWLAILLDANIAGAMATMAGLLFVIVFLFAPERGIIAVARRRFRQRWEFAGKMLAIHLLNHEGTKDEERESQIEHLEENLRWKETFAKRVVNYSANSGFVLVNEGRLILTDRGREYAKKSIFDEYIGN